MAEKLVYIGKIIALQPIPNADKIVSATVVCGAGGKWVGVVGKEQFVVGDLCRVYLQDSLLPKTEEFSFMEKQNYRVRIQRFRGVPSECLIMPLVADSGTYVIGDDITELADVTKYNKPLPASLQGIARGNFPSFIPKTDEPNFQTAEHLVQALYGLPYYITTKCDGSSATVYHHDYHFGVCSRNLELEESDDNIIWTLAKQYDLPRKLQAYDIAIQWETCGPSIQGNPLGLTKPGLFVFNVYGIDIHSYFSYEMVKWWCNELELPMVPLVEVGASFPYTTADELRRLAEGLYPNGQQREGIVIRAQQETRVNGDRLSFKVINPFYKD